MGFNPVYSIKSELHYKNNVTVLTVCYNTKTMLQN